MQILLGISAVAFFFLLFLGFFSWLFMREKEVKRRMDKLVTELDKATSKKMKKQRRQQLLQLHQTARRMGAAMSDKTRLQSTQDKLLAAGLLISAEEYMVIRLISAILGGILFHLLSGSVFLDIPGALAGWYGPDWVVRRKRMQRIAKFNEQLPDTLNTMSTSLRAGFSFAQAMKAAAEEMEQPMSEELSLVLRDIQWGSSLDESLYRLKQRVPSGDLDLMVEAVLIQRQVGGNLAAILSTIVNTIRERNRIYRQIKALTAQGRLSGIVIGVLPLALAIILYIMDESYIMTLFNHPIGIALVVAALISGIIGFMLIRKITTIEV